MILFPSTINVRFSNLGGRGRSLTTQSECDIVVNTKQEFLNAIKNHDVKIWIAKQLDLSSEVGLDLYCQLFSDGKRIYHRDLWQNADKIIQHGGCCLFNAKGDNVKLSGIKGIGPNPEILDGDYTYGQSGFIKVSGANFQIDNCVLDGWDTWGVWLFSAHMAIVRNNTIRNTRRKGYGYSLWQGGSGDQKIAVFENNIVMNSRHCVAASGHTNHLMVRYNYFGGTTSAHNIDRHNLNIPEFGGGEYNIHHNIFDTYSRHFGVQYPNDNNILFIGNNWFTQPLNNVGFVAEDPIHTISNPQVVLSLNKYERVNMNLLKSVPPEYVPPVVPLDNKLKFSYKRSYTGAENCYELQIIQGNTILTKFNLTGGLHGWRDVEIDAPDEDFSLKVVCLKPNSITVYIDDIVFRGKHWHFENNSTGELKQSFSPRPAGISQVGSGIKTWDAKTGKKCWVFAFEGTHAVGQWAELYYEI